MPARGLAQPDPPPADRAGAAAAPAGPQAIPLEHVFRAADDLEGPLRRAEGLAEPEPAVAEVERQVAAVARAAAELRAGLDGARLQEASAREIERLRQALQREDLALSTGQAALERRAEALASGLRVLEDRLAAWRLTAESATQAQAPAAVLERATRVEARLRTEQGKLRDRQARVLGLQAQVSDLKAAVAESAAAVDAADAALQRQLFEVESAPLWRGLAWAQQAGGLAGQVRQGLRENGRDVAGYLGEASSAPWLHLAGVVALGLALLALRRPLASLEAGDPALRAAVRVLARPWSAAFLLSLPLLGWLYPPLPPALTDLFTLAYLLPLLRLLPLLLPDPLRQPLLAFAALFALDKLAAVAPPRTLLARLALLAVAAGAAAGLAHGLRRGGWARSPRGGAWAAAARAGAVAALAFLAAAIVSSAIGNVTLAERLTHATLGAAARAAVMLGVVAVLEGAIAALLHLPALERRPLVANHRALLLRRAGTVARVFFALAWALRTLLDFGVVTPVAAALDALLDLRLRVGGLDVSLGNVAAFGVTLAAAIALARTIRFVLDEGVFAEVQLPRGVPAAISTTVHYALVVLGFSWAVLASGMEMSRFSFLLGALGVGIGLGLQGVVNNFVSGLILLYERPIQAGDIVGVGAVTGEVTRIGVRSSTVRTFDGAEVVVPNATLISAEVTNWTLSDRRRRVELAVGVAYGTEPQRVLDLLLEAVRGREGVLESPAPMALFVRFGESSIDFALRFWTADYAMGQQLASDVTMDVYQRLGRAGIEIPFPQRDLHVRSVDAAAAAALGGAPAGG